MDWSGSTKYQMLFNNAVATWNSYTNGIIRKDTATTINDVTIKDYSSKDDIYKAYTTKSGYIMFNIYKIDSLNDSNTYVSNALKEDVMLHELGHALGLGHTTHSWDVMRDQLIVSHIKPSLNDIASYNEAKKSY